MYTTQAELFLSPYGIDSIQKFEMLQQINEHTQINLTAQITEEEKKEAIKEAKAGDEIEIKMGADQKTIFSGIVKTAKLDCSTEVYTIKIIAFSNTILMDLEKRRVSYQNKKLSYVQLVNSIAKRNYPISKKVNVDYRGDKKATLKVFKMQYDETDWEFLKRLASQFHLGLIPNCKSSNIEYCFGIMDSKKEKREIKEKRYSLTKEVLNFLEWNENIEKEELREDLKEDFETIELQESDVEVYYVETSEFFSIGESMNFQNKTLVVKQVETKLGKAGIINKYLLTTPQGCSQKRIYNDKIIGLAIQGTVKQVLKDTVKVEFALDEKFNMGNAKEFPYATMYTAEKTGNTGFYCMPEEEDTVLVYFPSKDEKEGVAIHSFRKYSIPKNKIEDPNVKYFRTANGKELKLAPKEIVLTAMDGITFIQLDEEKGITIKSSHPIRIETEKELQLKSENILIEADREIQLKCKNSKIQLDGTVIIEGKEIKEN